MQYKLLFLRQKITRKIEFWENNEVQVIFCQILDWKYLVDTLIVLGSIPTEAGQMFLFISMFLVINDSV